MRAGKIFMNFSKQVLKKNTPTFNFSKNLMKGQLHKIGSLNQMNLINLNYLIEIGSLELKESQEGTSIIIEDEEIDTM